MRRRILVAIVVVTAIAVVLFAVPLAFAVANLYHNEEIVRLEREAAAAAGHVPVEFPTSADAVELPTLQAPRVVAFYDRTGRRVAGTGPGTADRSVREALRGGVHDATTSGTLVAAVPLTRGEQVVGVIRAASPVSIVDDRTRRAVLLMAAIGAAVVAISAAIAAWQARRLARPVGALGRTATALGHGDFTVRSEPAGVAEVDAVSEALNSTAERLDQMLSRERAFSEDASHQLRTSLAGLRLILEAARLDPTLDRATVLRETEAQIERLEETLDELLALARGAPAQREPIDLEPVIDELASNWTGRLASQGRPLRVVTEPDLPAAGVAAGAVRQVLDVLLDNAVRHGAGTITVESHAVARGLVINVEDEGAGIAGDAEHVFQRRGRGARDHGIGLALARSLAEAEGGKLQVSRTGPGPVFSLFLPQATVSADPVTS